MTKILKTLDRLAGIACSINTFPALTLGSMASSALAIAAGALPEKEKELTRLSKLVSGFTRVMANSCGDVIRHGTFGACYDKNVIKRQYREVFTLLAELPLDMGGSEELISGYERMVDENGTPMEQMVTEFKKGLSTTLSKVGHIFMSQPEASWNWVDVLSHREKYNVQTGPITYS